MYAKFFRLVALLLALSLPAFSQAPPQEFFNGLDHLTTDQPQAKKDFQAAIAKAPQFHGSYHFLGVIYINEHKPDSAIACFITSIGLNTGNVNHTREMAYVRLVQTYTQQQAFDKAFDAAWQSYKQYPDNRGIFRALHDLCLWAYYIRNNSLSPSYLSIDIQPEYVVKDIDEEYLITRNVHLGNDFVDVEGQSLVYKNKAAYDVLHCVTATADKRKVDLSFKLDWDMGKYISGAHGPLSEVAADTRKPVYERAGALLLIDPKTDLKAGIEKMMQ